MWKRSLLVLAAILLSFPGMADAGVRIGIGLGFGIPIGPYPYYGYGYPYPYYAPYAYPGPVVVQQPAVVMPAPTVYQMQPAPTTAPAVVGNAPSYSAPQPVVAGSPPPAPTFQTSPPPTGVVQSGYDHSAVDGLLQRLSQPDENTRRDACMDLGRMKADRAIDTLTSVLAHDSSPVVRDAAARGLGLIGSTRSLPALIRAAQADNDRDVRHSAQFAIEVIRSQLRR